MNKKLLIINSVINLGSTGRISESIGLHANKNGWETYVAYGRSSNKSKLKTFRIGGYLSNSIHLLLTRLFDIHGLISIFPTLKLIYLINKLKPNVINIHNIHGYYVNYYILFKYLKRKDIPVAWTLHDCWAFTGHCIYFDFSNCAKWKTNCKSCPQLKTYPKSSCFDNSSFNYKIKKKIFNEKKELTLIPVSNWMNSLLSSSFLNKIRTKVIHNGIDINSFRPIEKFNYKLINQIERDKFIILGVAYQWTERKGFSDFIKLSSRIDDRYKIILVGLNNKQINHLPHNIIGIRRTESTEQLAELYSFANIYINTTFEDNYPTTNLESIACGTPVITYNTGGSIESICEKTGFIVEKGDIDAIIKILNNLESKINLLEFRDNCREKALSFFNKNDTFDKYLNIFNKLSK